MKSRVITEAEKERALRYRIEYLESIARERYLRQNWKYIILKMLDEEEQQQLDKAYMSVFNKHYPGLEGI